MEARINGWIARIMKVKKGREIIGKIQTSKHDVTLIHDHNSLNTAGKTQSPLTLRIFDGRGDWAKVFFAFDIPASGSHLLFNCDGETIIWPAIVNFFHELSHAAHTVNGTMIYNIEYQAIQDENEFRSQLSKVEPIDDNLRCYHSAEENIRTFLPPKADH